jgi:hypothetical protein
MITIPAPAVPSPTLPLEKPLSITLAGLTFGDGSALGASDSAAIGVLVFRGSPGTAEVWDDARKSWRPTPPDNQLLSLKPVTAVAKNGAFTATLVAVGQKDSAGDDVFTVAAGGVPSYFMRAVAKARHAGEEESGQSPPSPAFTFTSSAENARFAASFDTPSTKPDEAHKVRLQLKGDAMQPAGFIEIRALPSFEVEIANCDSGGNTLARVVLQSSGEIHLTPAAGQRVVIDGDAETNRLLYAPAGGGAKHWLA